MKNEAALAARGITKIFPGARALHDVDLACRPGRVHALLGENGAGKSTLVRVLTGGLQPDQGTLTMADEQVTFLTPRDAAAQGVAAVYQELSVLPHMSVAHNILLGQERTTFGFIRPRDERDQVDQALGRVGLDGVDPSRPAGELSLASRQLIEIARACLRRSKVLVLDEPTAVLAGAELDRLFSIIRSLTADGVAVVFISHRLGEVSAISDDVTVLRDGALVSSAPIATYDEGRMVRDMVGRDVDTIFPDLDPPKDQVILTVLADVHGDGGSSVPLPNLQLRAGEIVALAGLLGSGRSRLLRALAGVREAVGSVAVNDARVGNGVKGAIRSGIALVPEERKSEGLVLNLPVRANITLADLRTVSRHGLMSTSAEDRAYTASRSMLGIRAAGGDQATVELSGGNQQKVVLAKWLRTAPRVLLLDEPTRGIDVGARSEIYTLIADLASQGMAVLFASSDLPEVIGLAHRVLVCWEGSVVGELTGVDITDENIMRLAMGSKDSLE